MKPRILVLVDHYLPGYLAGGPIRSVANLADHLADDFDWQVVTRDRDLHADQPYEGVSADGWMSVGPAKVRYLSPRNLTPLGMIKLLRVVPHDLLYLNSFFSARFAVLPMLARRLGLLPRRPVLLAPRGEFSAGALALKAGKKRLFIGLARLCCIHRDALWHASTPLEADDIARSMGAPRERILIASDLGAPSSSPTTTPRSARAPDCTGGLRVCFLSRISRKKNLDYALRALAHVRSTVSFSIFGPAEDAAYWRECEALIATLPANVTVQYRGPIPNERVRDHLSTHDLFFLPTHGENFGHVIVEALASGLPVLISDQTPWRDLQAPAVGWDLPLEDESAFATVIDEVAQWPSSRLDQVRDQCLTFAAAHLADPAAVDDNRRLFAFALPTMPTRQC